MSESIRVFYGYRLDSGGVDEIDPSLACRGLREGWWVGRNGIVFSGPHARRKDAEDVAKREIRTRDLLERARDALARYEDTLAVEIGDFLES